MVFHQLADLIFGSKQQLFDQWALTYDWLLPSVAYQAIHLRLLEFVALPERATVLDMGCGTGQLLNRLANAFPTMRGIGLDFSAQMLRQARRQNRHHPRLLYIQGNAEGLPFATEQLDGVFSTLSFLHYPNPQSVLAEVARVLRSRASFYWVDPIAPPWVASQQLPISPGGICLYSPAHRATLGQDAGLTCLGHHHLLGSVVLTIFSR
ncbi:class I SAM-dependent methyltransferase [Oscillatoria sp. FACHB-1407]|uniref:class I SAM-dependent methyltransferase n=1 Tax=Oscillatoria sp. FACHB-1407 TaxID=2692847 RepID=UPI00168534FB|nr:class I SAM-dependent methyltransferase [Oscillatoria sp. FACHB-1407]MBD2461205.1 class I SAM-dependent methyltransferase [Oscillatoria sp. FACHB-1407]